VAKLAASNFFDGSKFFRAIDGFMVQFGLPADPNINSQWSDPIDDDPSIGISNAPGTVSFAMAGPRSRTTQLFINLVDNQRLDGMGFTPVGEIGGGADGPGMQVVRQLYSGYGEGAPSGNGPNQGRIQAKGNAYLESNFPKLSTIISTTWGADKTVGDVADQDCTPTHDGGVIKHVKHPGEGGFPPKGSTITAHYTGTLASDGSQFDSSHGKAPFHFTLGAGQVIKGWDYGFATMKKGEQATLTITSQYAYGFGGHPPVIPGGATLIFEVELLAFN